MAIENIELRKLLERYVSEDTYSFQDYKVLEVNSIGRELETPLHLACGRGAVDDVKTLLEGGANVNAATDIGTTPLMCAVYRGGEILLEMLLKAGANSNSISKFGDTALRIAVNAKKPPTTIALLKAYGAREI